ncbi:MAG: sugar transferase [Beijerinckiaceae bacterium]
MSIEEAAHQFGHTHESTPLGGVAKRAFDIVAAIAGLVVLSPLFIGVALLVWVTSGRPLFIQHNRVGYGGRLFPCLKFRTMVVNAQEALEQHLAAHAEARIEWEQTHKLKNDPRVTSVGRVLRQLSVDELPQLVNIVVGQMSVVGPRPIVPKEVEKYGSAIDDYLAARPGLTGLWQVNGRSDTSYEMRVLFDTEYVRTWSMSGDISIILRTIPAVLKAEGTY